MAGGTKLQVEKKTGIFFGIIFLFAGFINLARAYVYQSVPGFQISVFLMVALPIGIGLLFLSTGLIFPKIRQIQGFILIATSPLSIVEEPLSFFGLGLYVSGIVLLFMFQFFKTYGLLKIIICLLYLYVLEIIALSAKEIVALDAVFPVFFMTAFLVFLYIVFQEKILVYLKPKKPVLKLTERGLSDTEALYVCNLIAGKTAKEIAYDKGVAESTVRNTLSRAYRKLGVPDRVGLISLTEQYEVTA